MARIHGKRGQVKMDETGGSPWTDTDVADISAFTLNLLTEKVNVTAFGDTNIQKVTGLPDFNGTLSGWWNSLTTPRLFDVVLGSTPVHLALYPSRDEATFYFEGLAYIDGAIDVPATGGVSFSGNWDAADNWTQLP